MSFVSDFKKIDEGVFLPVVDAELLEAVDGEVLEAGDVEDADVVGGALEGDALVDLGHDVVEEARVRRLGQCVPIWESGGLIEISLVW